MKESEKKPWQIRADYVKPEFKIKIEYSASCNDCGFTITDNVRDDNEEDALSNIKTICDGWHNMENITKRIECKSSLSIQTKTTYL